MNFALYDNPLIMIPGEVKVLQDQIFDFPELILGTWTKMASYSENPGQTYSTSHEALTVFAKIADLAYTELKNREISIKHAGVSRTQILRYLPGEEHGLHVDDQFKVPERIGKTKVALNLLNQFGCLAFNVSDDFTGGELVFPDQNLTIHPKTGMVVMWPSNRRFPHEVLPVKTGVRYTYVRHFYVAS